MSSYKTHGGIFASTPYCSTLKNGSWCPEGWCLLYGKTRICSCCLRPTQSDITSDAFKSLQSVRRMFCKGPHFWGFARFAHIKGLMSDRVSIKKEVLTISSSPITTCITHLQMQASHSLPLTRAWSHQADFLASVSPQNTVVLSCTKCIRSTIFGTKQMISAVASGPGCKPGSSRL